MKPVVVPDALVILKWVLKMDEDHVEKALALLSSWTAGETEIVLPSLWVYEVGNIVGRKNAERAEEIMALLLDYRFPEARIETGHLLVSLDLMRRHAVTFYDASYHAVALNAGGTFVTADDAYVRRAGNAGHVVSLKDYPI